MHDKFGAYLRCKKKPNREKALTAKSYKNKDHSVQDKDTNCELATYGDALLKVAYCKILFEEDVENITEEKKQYEGDKVLVEVIAQHYELLKYMRYDKDDDKILQNYNYEEPSRKGKESRSKYIATAVEALLAAIYLDNEENIDLVVEIAKHWKKLIVTKQQRNRMKKELP